MQKLLLALNLFLASFMLSAQNTVVDVIVNSPDHNTLEAAVVAADLVGALNGTGPFTVFAPTDDAFAALPAGTVDALLADPQGALTDILLYHVVGANALSTDLMDGMTITTLNGDDVTVTINNDGVFINDAQVTVADIPADNGVVHVINAVLIPPTTTVVDVIVNSPDHNTLEAAVLAADLAGTLSGDGPFTVFAPTDAAFAALPAGTIDALLADPQGLLTDILLYHVVGANALSTDLMDGMSITTINGKDVTVTINNDGVFINDAQVTVADITTDNGVVHVIDAVLIPPTVTVVDVIVNSPDHNTLETAVLAADLAGTLSGDGPFTVFAPTDDAFAAIPQEVLDAVLSDPQGALTDILLYHVVGANALSTDLMDGMTITTLNGGDVTVTINNDGVFINDAQVTVADITTDNGVVHVIDAVLLPPTETVVDVIVDSPIHNTLEAAVIAADLVETLSGEGPFTVFAPTDEAFAALPAGTIDALLADPQGALTDILLYHVVGANALSTDLMDGMTITTINGKDVTVTINNDGVFINDAQVTVADIVTANGVVHVIDAVLIPPTITVVDVIVNSPDHNTLEAAVIAADLAGTLSGDGPFTVFAPTDDAFAALPAGTIDALLADPQGALTDILLYHVVGANALSTDLMDGMTITTLNGADVTVTINNDGVFINDAQVTVADITTDNGVVHVIDAVLLPPAPSNSIFDVIANSPDHNTLESVIELAGLSEALANDGPLTVFAPTDAAFAALPQPLLDALIEDPQGLLTSILLYHVVAGEARSTDLSDGQSITTVIGADIQVTINNDGIFINDAQVTVADIEADNGIVHVIDAVLTPSAPTVAEIIIESPVHNTLEAAVVAAGLAETLNNDGPFTVFAPTDGAFAALPDGTLDALLADPQGLLTDILLYHVVGAPALSTDLSDGQVITTLNGKDITITINNDGVFINDAQVVFADLIASNGVVHVIDAVLIPPTRTVVDVIVESPDHNTLEAAVVAADLAGTLSGDGPFTVFAPTDDAFAALPAGTIDALLADPQGALTDILLYHVVGAEALSTDLSDGMMVTTLNGQTVTVSITNDGVFINNAQVTVADITTDNGVVHVIDTVLLPETSSTDELEEAFARINLFPNPAYDFITVDLNGFDASNAVFRVCDMQGRILKTIKDANNRFDINISDLDGGMYFMEYRTANNSYQKKFVKK